MNEKFMPFLLDFYCREVVTRICEKYSLSEFDAMRRFLFSQTYEMLSNPKMAMWEFGQAALFEIWECEQETGDPRNSPFIAGE